MRTGTQDMNRMWMARLALLTGAAMLIALLAACGDTASERAAATAISTAPSPTAGRETEAVSPTSLPQDTESPTADDSQQGAFHATAEPETVEPATSGITPTSDTATESAAEEPDQADEPPQEPANPAPELASAGAWYNSEPLTLAELRGQPVLLVFWATY